MMTLRRPSERRERRPTGVRVDASTSRPRSRTGHHREPDLTRIAIEDLDVQLQRAIDVEIVPVGADARVVVQVLAEVRAAEVPVVHTVEDVGVPHDIDVRRRGDRRAPALTVEHEELEVAVDRRRDLLVRPVGLLATHERPEPVDVDEVRQGRDMIEHESSNSTCWLPGFRRAASYVKIVALSTMPPNLKSFYDSLYSKTPKIFGDSTRNWDEVVLQTLKPKAGVALDVGAGEGITSNLLADYGYRVDALDLSDNAFVGINHDSIRLFKSSVQDFNWESDYDLIQIALVLHHLGANEVQGVVQAAQEHTRTGGLHLLRVFTTKSEFFKKVNGDYFFDNGINLNELYKGWEICLDDYVIAQAATADLTNEIRQVVFRKID